PQVPKFQSMLDNLGLYVDYKIEAGKLQIGGFKRETVVGGMRFNALYSTESPVSERQLRIEKSAPEAQPSAAPPVQPRISSSTPSAEGLTPININNPLGKLGMTVEDRVKFAADHPMNPHAAEDSANAPDAPSAQINKA